MRRPRCTMRGDTLLEVLLAMVLLGGATLALARLQLELLHGQHVVARRECALRLADAVAESLRAGVSSAATRPLWEAQIARALPAGALRIEPFHPAVRRIVVSWTEAGAHRHGSAMSACGVRIAAHGAVAGGAQRASMMEAGAASTACVALLAVLR